MKNRPSNPYEDMLSLPHPVSAKHPQMPQSKRAAQFSPFAALTGYEDAIAETARLTECQVELDEEKQQNLNQILTLLQQRIDTHPPVEITYFVPDTKKSGGAYVTVAGTLTKIDTYQKFLLLEPYCQIPLERIYEILSPTISDF